MRYEVMAAFLAIGAVACGAKTGLDAPVDLDAAPGVMVDADAGACDPTNAPPGPGDLCAYMQGPVCSCGVALLTQRCPPNAPHCEKLFPEAGLWGCCGDSPTFRGCFDGRVGTECP